MIPITDPELRAAALAVADSPNPNGKPKRAPKPSVPVLVAVDGQSVYKSKAEQAVCVVENLLFRGVTVFAGRPKVGKSWATLQLALAVATGTPFLGTLPIRKTGRVVYLALEEPQRRTTNRLRKVTDDQVFLQNIHFVYSIRPLLAGGAAQLDQYLTDNPAELVVIDTLLAILQANSRKDVLRGDYQEINMLRELADKHETAIVVVHHLRKATAEFSLDAVAGTTGVTAAADCIWTLRKLPGGDCILDLTGRESEDQSYALRLDSTADRIGWSVIGTGEEAGISEERKEILELLKDEAPLKPAKIAQMLRKNAVTVRRLMQKLHESGLVNRNRDGGYVLASSGLSQRIR